MHFSIKLLLTPPPLTLMKYFDILLDRQNSERRRVSDFLRVVLVSMLVGNTGILALAVASGWTRSVGLSMGIMPVIFLALILIYRRLVLPSSLVTLAVLIFTVGYSSYYGDGIHDVSVILLPIIILLASFLLKKIWFMITTFISLATLGFIIILRHINVVDENYGSDQFIEYLVVVIFLLVTAIGIRLLTGYLQDNLNKVRYNELKFRTIFDNARDAIFILDKSGKIDCNRMADQIFGGTHEEVLAGSPWTMSPERQPNGRLSVELGLEYIQKAEAGVPQVFEWRHSRLDGTEFDAEVSINVIRIRTGDVLQTVVHDITEHKHVRQTEAALRQATKLAEIGALAAGVAHELRNPLSAVIQSMQVIKQRLIQLDLPGNQKSLSKTELPASKLQKYLEDRNIPHLFDTTREAYHRADDIISNLLNYSRKTRSEYGLNDLSQLVRETMKLTRFNKAVHKLNSINIEIGDNLPPIECQLSEIQQVLLNLINNAAQACMEVKSADFFSQVDIEVQKQDSEFVRLTVSNNGPQLTEEGLDEVFEPFFTTKDRDAGTGLGLFICKQIVVEGHHGRIFAERGESEGMHFIIDLPMTQPRRD